jgi:hypothetical protein
MLTRAAPELFVRATRVFVHDKLHANVRWPTNTHDIHIDGMVDHTYITGFRPLTRWRA